VFTLSQQKALTRVPSNVVTGDNAASASSTPAQFKPRPPKAGGKKRVLALPSSAPISISQTGSIGNIPDAKPTEQTADPRPGMKDQDDFRKMLLSRRSN
jgi:hypothetical protein